MRGASFIVGDILSDRGARSVTFGLKNELATTFWSAVKTGTSKDMRDNWCVGFSDRYTVGVWVGNFDGQPMWDVSGVSGAAPVWRDVMDYLHRDQPSSVRRRAAGVVRQQVAFQPAWSRRAANGSCAAPRARCRCWCRMPARAEDLYPGESASSRSTRTSRTRCSGCASRRRRGRD
jgi:penicillin-binding protein 1C